MITQTTGSVTTFVEILRPTIAYWNNDYSQTARVTRVGSPLYVQVSAPGCAVTNITITSTLTGDSETFPAVQVSPGLFRPAGDVLTQQADTVAPNGILETTPNDILLATVSDTSCGSAVDAARILIDPFGVVFDSHNNSPIANASVTLINTNCNCPATVWQPDGVTPAPATVTTGADGRFEFPLVEPGGYRLVVVPPTGYTHPSAVAPGSLPAGRTIDTAGSYGGVFVVDASTGTVRLDVPVDASTTDQYLFVEKSANKQEAELGDSVIYTVKIQNNTSNLVTGVTLLDDLPAGFRYERGTARLDGVKMDNPTGSPGPRLTFAVGSIPAGGTVTVSYRVRVGAGALQGTGRNRARATAAGPVALSSNTSIVKVTVRAGVFTDKAIIIGKVFVDLNRNTLQDEGEPGVPGVRLYLQDGTYVVTDSEGKYSFYGLRPRTHVLKLDETTLPKGWQASPLTPRHHRRGLTCLADLKNASCGRLILPMCPATPTCSKKSNAAGPRAKWPSPKLPAASSANSPPTAGWRRQATPKPCRPRAWWARPPTQSRPGTTRCWPRRC